MRLIIDTTTGLAVVDGSRDFSRLEAVIIGSWHVPACIGVLEGDHVDVVPTKLADLVELRSDSDSRAFQRLVETLRRDSATDDGPIRIRVAEWLSV